MNFSIRRPVGSERERLKEEIKSASAVAEQAATAARLEAAMTHSVDTETLEAEVARIEASIQAISAIIDAPETELSLVIRKNVERAELESYLREFASPFQESANSYYRRLMTQSKRDFRFRAAGAIGILCR